MKTNQYSHIKLAGLLALGGLFTQSLHAMPMFSQQTGMECSGCHMQQIPKLNKFGRKFVASGMTLTEQLKESNSTKGILDNTDMHVSVLAKLKYEKSYDKPTKSGHIQTEDTTNDGEWSGPRTLSLFIAGKVMDDVGALIRGSYRKEEDASLSGKVVYAKAIEDGYVGVSFYSFSNFGPFSGMELYNTGLYKPIRSFEIKKYVNATQVCEIGTGAATGLQVYYDKDGILNEDDHFFVTVGAYAPDQNNHYLNLGDNMLPFARIAYEYEIGDFNLIFGAFAINGGSETSATSPLRIKRETYGFDFQLEGEVYEKSISVIATNVVKNVVTYTGLGANSTKDLQSIENEAFSIETEVMATDAIGLKLAYLQYNDLMDYERRRYINVGDIDAAVTIGVDYTFVLGIPMKFAIEHSWITPNLDRVENYRDLLFTLTMTF